MKKFFLLILLLSITLACTISLPDDSLDDNTATQVAIALTATALDLQINQQVTETSSAEQQDEPSATATNTPAPPDDPKQELDQPTWRDSLSNGKNWQLDENGTVYGATTFSVQSGKLSAKMDTVGKFNWLLNYLTFKDAYLEAMFEVTDCKDDDQYGLIIRAPDYDSGLGYYFHVTCDGHYDLKRWSENGSIMLLDMPSSDKINKGPNQTNTLGMWAKGPIIRLYVNNNLLEEVNDSALLNDGHFGLFINARKTSGFTVNMDEIDYWTLD